jgi:hypothetical protein
MSFHISYHFITLAYQIIESDWYCQETIWLLKKSVKRCISYILIVKKSDGYKSTYLPRLKDTRFNTHKKSCPRLNTHHIGQYRITKRRTLF